MGGGGPPKAARGGENTSRPLKKARGGFESKQGPPKEISRGGGDWRGGVSAAGGQLRSKKKPAEAGLRGAAITETNKARLRNSRVS